MHVYCVAPMEHLITCEWYTTSYREACREAQAGAAEGHTTTVSRVYLQPPCIASIVACLNHERFAERTQDLLTYTPRIPEDGEGQAPFPVHRTVVKKRPTS